MLLSPVSKSSLLFFFFQAEDGIRDYKVTGVQTCALPISRHTRHRVFSDFELITFGASFFLGHADAAKLRVGEDAVRHGPISDREILPFHQIAVNDLEIVVGDVRESRTALAIAEGPNTGNVRLKAT